MAKKKSLDEKDLSVFLKTIEKSIKNIIPELNKYVPDGIDPNDYALRIVSVKDRVRVLNSEDKNFALLVSLDFDLERVASGIRFGEKFKDRILLGDSISSQHEKIDELLKSVTETIRSKGGEECVFDLSLDLVVSNFKRSGNQFRIELLENFMCMAENLTNEEVSYIDRKGKRYSLESLSGEIEHTVASEEQVAISRKYFDRLLSSGKIKISSNDLKNMDGVMKELAHTFKSQEIEDLYLPMLKDNKEIHNRKVLSSLIKFVPELKIKSPEFKLLLNNSQNASTFCNEVLTETKFITLDSAKLVDVFKVRTVKKTGSTINNKGLINDVDYTNDMKKDVTKLIFNLLTMKSPGIDMQSFSGINSYTMVDLPGQKGIIALDVNENYSKEQVEKAISFAVSFVDITSRDFPFPDGFLVYGLEDAGVKDALKKIFLAKELSHAVDGTVDNVEASESESQSQSFKL